MKEQPATKAQLIALRDALLRWRDKDAAAAVDNVIDILSNSTLRNSTKHEEDLGTRCIISGGEILEI